jgi:hypothetical protein
MDKNKRIFNNYGNAMVQASTIATETKKVIVVGMNAETGKFHVMEKDSPELLETIEDDLFDEGMGESEKFVNCMNVHPN